MLELLSKKPMSGSEIMSEIEERTHHHWKPSPGSVYPLLSWLQDNKYVKELPVEENGMKRYMLTDEGEALLEEQRKIKMKLRKEAKFMPPPFLGGLWLRIPPEKAAELGESMRRLVADFFELGSTLEEKFSEQAIEEVQKILNETAEKLEELNRKLGGKQDE